MFSIKNLVFQQNQDFLIGVLLLLCNLPKKKKQPKPYQKIGWAQYSAPEKLYLESSFPIS